jgi:hypothetical protein
MNGTYDVFCGVEARESWWMVAGGSLL